MNCRRRRIPIGKADRKRWDGNIRSMAIIAKPDSEITTEDIEFLRKNYTSSGGLLPNAYSGGAFFTPTHVARFIVEALRGITGGFRAGQRWLEPSCGSGAFLEFIPEDAEITAIEIDKTSARVASLIYPKANVIQADAFTHDRRNYYDFVVGNPPFGVTIDITAEDLPDEFETLRVTKGRAKGKSEYAFVELAIKAVKPGGYIAIILPLGIGLGQAAEKVRTLLYRNCWHVATILLPPETFAHVGTSVGTQILIVRKATPNARMIPVVTKRWGSYFKRSDYGDIAQFNAKFLEGQTPAYFAVVTDIGYDKDGKPTDKWGDGRTQLDELIDDFTDPLVRENLYPHVPSWYSVKDVSAFMFSHGNGSCDGYRDSKATYPYGPYRWNELTLGAGEEIEWNGREVSTWDFGWQDEIVAEFYAKERNKEGATRAAS